jgi:2-polyprenyl-3-methyl-5-hydroxy-6-metoxy-1,4-benzoquinol methylase
MHVTVVSTGFRPSTRQKCVDSVASQVGVRFRHVVIDASEQDPPKEPFENLVDVVRDLPDDEVVACLDLDDWLATPTALQTVVRMHEEGAWVTYGSYMVVGGGREGEYQDYCPDENVRKAPWGASHLKTFRAGLFKKVHHEDLKFGGRWIPHARDHALMFPLLEMAGPLRRKRCSEVLVVYSVETSTHWLDHHRPETYAEEDRLRRVICARPAYPEIFSPASAKDPSAIYTRAWYDQEYTGFAPQWEAQQAAAAVVCDLFKPKRVVDFGCGPGMLVRALRDRGVDAVGVDGSDNALDHADPAVRPFLSRMDLTAPQLGWPDDADKPDLVVCTEVAEHLEAQFADRLVSTLTHWAGETLVLTAAFVGQGGHDHVNERPPEYWIDKVQNSGFLLNRARTDALKAAWRPITRLSHLSLNAMVFERAYER